MGGHGQGGNGTDLLGSSNSRNMLSIDLDGTVYSRQFFPSGVVVSRSGWSSPSTRSAGLCKLSADGGVVEPIVVSNGRTSSFCWGHFGAATLWGARKDGVLRQKEVDRSEMGYESVGQRSRLRSSFRIAEVRRCGGWLRRRRSGVEDYWLMRTMRAARVHFSKGSSLGRSSSILLPRTAK
jgi:hypothetical protein